MRPARRLVVTVALVCLGVASPALAGGRGPSAGQETSGINTGGRGHVTSVDDGTLQNLRATCRYESEVDALGLNLAVAVEGTAVASAASMVHHTEVRCWVENADGSYTGSSGSTPGSTASVSFGATMSRKAITVCAAATGQATPLTYTVHKACWGPTSVRITAYGHITIRDRGDGLGPQFTYSHCLAPDGDCVTAPGLQGSFVCSGSTSPTVTARCVPNTPPDYVWTCSVMSLSATTLAGGATGGGGKVRATSPATTARHRSSRPPTPPGRAPTPTQRPTSGRAGASAT